jgi:exodeoxyribonuclease III
MRLFTWNVNGIRSVASKGFGQWLETHHPDIVAVQEIKARPEQLEPSLVQPNGYHAVWFPAQKPGYSGVAVYSKAEPTHVRYGLGTEEFDNEGRVVEVEFKNFVLLNAYFPNSQRDHARLDYKLAFCDAMRRRLDTLRNEGKHFLLCGDFNIAHKEIDLKNPKQNLNNAGFLPAERSWMDQLLAAGYVDTFREFHPEPGHYTWWSYRPGVREKNIGWRLDYFVCNPEFKDRLEDAAHHPMVHGSDHCPVELRLKT